MKAKANSQSPTWLPNGGAGSPNGLTEGVWFVEWQQLKATNDTPFAAIAALPPAGAAREIVRIRLGFPDWYSAYRKPLRHAMHGPPQLCIKQLYAILRMATPAKPFRGGLLAYFRFRRRLSHLADSQVPRLWKIWTSTTRPMTAIHMTRNLKL